LSFGNKRCNYGRFQQDNPGLVRRPAQGVVKNLQDLIHLEVRRIKQEWSENTARFQKLYQGKWICLKGIVGRVHKPLFSDRDCLALLDSNAISSSELECSFADNEQLVQLKSSESVMLVGVMEISRGGTQPFLTKCYLVSGALANDPQARAMQQRARADEEREKRQREELAAAECDRCV
jgi:hypothetical protein